ncbi:hypothetical protein GX50_04205 [[Emmonsia] crescens]|uniref:Uncharacterized protein n=1 Tax=[Emmonsia] crescens TaxID=73230 RepID=A0A2B7ZI33_9EURO|nr:hypothetical protein GX50_04205 [Emmonsia crescens]
MPMAQADKTSSLWERNLNPETKTAAAESRKCSTPALGCQELAYYRELCKEYDKKEKEEKEKEERGKGEGRKEERRK